MQYEKIGRLENSSSLFQDQEIFSYLTSLLEDATLKSCKEKLGVELEKFYEMEITTCADLIPYGIDDSLSSSTEETFFEALKKCTAPLSEEEAKRFESYTYSDRMEAERALHILLLKRILSSADAP